MDLVHPTWMILGRSRMISISEHLLCPFLPQLGYQGISLGWARCLSWAWYSNLVALEGNDLGMHNRRAKNLGNSLCPTCNRRWIEKVSQKDREIWRLGSHTKTDFISITFWLTIGLEPGKTTWWRLSVSSWKLSVSYHLACPLIWWCSLNCNSISGKRSFNFCPASGLMRNTLAQESRAWALKGEMTWVYISALPFTLLALWHWQMYKWHYLACGVSLMIKWANTYKTLSTDLYLATLNNSLSVLSENCPLNVCLLLHRNNFICHVTLLLFYYFAFCFLGHISI